jgi:ACS family tartrate transporter-like MFS transporter
MFWWGLRSDRLGERVTHAALANLIAALALLLAVLLHDPLSRCAAFSISFAATLATIVPFWAAAGDFLAGASAAGGIAAISAIGVTGGFLAPYFVGAMKDLTGDFKTGLFAIALFAAALSVLFYLLGNRQLRARQHPG